MEEHKDSGKQGMLEPEELERVTGGAAWMDDPEAIENYRERDSASGGGIVTEPSKKAGPVSAAGALDRFALGIDRVKERLTSAATHK